MSIKHSLRAKAAFPARNVNVSTLQGGSSIIHAARLVHGGGSANHGLFTASFPD